MKNKSNYRRLAERISQTMSLQHGCCCGLPLEEALDFKEFFEPSFIEKRRYKHHGRYWMQRFYELRDYKRDLTEGNNMRILALLFMDEITQTEKK